MDPRCVSMFIITQFLESSSYVLSKLPNDFRFKFEQNVNEKQICIRDPRDGARCGVILCSIGCPNQNFRGVTAKKKGWSRMFGFLSINRHVLSPCAYCDVKQKVKMGSDWMQILIVKAPNEINSNSNSSPEILVVSGLITQFPMLWGVPYVMTMWPISKMISRLSSSLPMNPLPS